MNHLPRNIILIFAVFLLAACQPAPTTVPTSATATLPAPSQTPEPTVTPTATLSPTIDPLTTLPVEWQGKIDHIETLDDGRTVAVEKSTDPNEPAVLRVLQLDPETKEWLDYVPTIGWAGQGEWESPSEGLLKSRWKEDELQVIGGDSLLPPLKLTDGTELPMGELGTIYFCNSDRNGYRFTFFQGYVLDVGFTQSNSPNAPDVLTVYAGIPLKTGDWQIYVTTYPDQPNAIANLFLLETLQASDLDGTKDLGQVSLSGPRSTNTMHAMYTYLVDHGGELVGQPIIMGIQFNPDDKNDFNSYDQNQAKTRFTKALEQNTPTNIAEINQVFFSPSIIPTALWEQIKGN